MSEVMEFIGGRRPSIEDTLMACANIWALRSSCSRSQVGAVFASADNRILVTGYNGAPAGMRHCVHTCTCDGWVETGQHEDGCHATRPCEVAVHAEANAIAYAARNGIMLQSSMMYVTMSPCYKCAQLIINAGVDVVYYFNAYRDLAGVELLRSAGIEVVQYTHA